MEIYAISDTHFGHDKLVELSGRPEDFTKKILRNVEDQKNRTPIDVLIHCGDFCIGKDEEWHEAWRVHTFGIKKKILVRGNHDNKSDSWYYNHGWDFVCSSFVHTYFGKRLLFTHMPMAIDLRFTRNIHGHLHGNSHRHNEHREYDPTWHFDLAPEIRDYKAVNLEKIEHLTLHKP